MTDVTKVVAIERNYKVPNNSRFLGYRETLCAMDDSGVNVLDENLTSKILKEGKILDEIWGYKKYEGYELPSDTDVEKYYLFAGCFLKIQYTHVGCWNNTVRLLIEVMGERKQAEDSFLKLEEVIDEHYKRHRPLWTIGNVVETEKKIVCIN